MRIKNQEERVLKMLLDLYTLTKDDWFYLSRIKIRESYNIGYNYSGIILENLFSKKRI